MIALLGFLICLVGSTSAFYTIGFRPQLSPGCSTNLAAFARLLPLPSCNILLSNIYNSTNEFNTCSSGKGGVNCFDVSSVAAAAEQAKYLVPAYRIPDQSSCALCTPANGMIAGCSSLIEISLDAVYGKSTTLSSLQISNATVFSNLQKLAHRLVETCNAVDKASLTVLKYQAMLLCDSSNTFNRTVTSVGTLTGVLDMRPLTQCGTCAILPCLPGQYCDGSSSAMSCPESFYCPTPTEKIKCPEGYFCPVASTSPKKCRGVAEGSCPEGSAREVVWVPLFIACIFLLIICNAEYILHVVKKSPNSEVKVYEYGRIPLSNGMNFSTQTSPVSIEFNNVELISGNTKRVSGVSGLIKPKTFTAILGGSGAGKLLYIVYCILYFVTNALTGALAPTGKTSLMNVILGREALTAGDVSFVSDDYGGGRIPAHLLDRIVAFVPQNEVYLREMTVEELVLHSARWRLPNQLDDAKIRERVEEVLSQLQLQHLRHVVVGGSEQTFSKGDSAGLSPGDRKKVNIALELVAGPNVLFLDEPTTGIDSSSALNVARIIHNLARSGLTCVAVIHQPRSEIFSLIDEMIILVRGGKVAYQGPTKYIIQYFATYGLTLPSPKANKTDFLIDITSKPPPSDWDQYVVSTSSNNQVLGSTKTPSDENVEEGLNTASSTHKTWADLWDLNGTVSHRLF